MKTDQIKKVYNKLKKIKVVDAKIVKAIEEKMTVLDEDKIIEK